MTQLLQQQKSKEEIVLLPEKWIFLLQDVSFCWSVIICCRCCGCFSPHPNTSVDQWCWLKLHHSLSNKLQTFCVETMSKQPSKTRSKRMEESPQKTLLRLQPEARLLLLQERWWLLLAIHGNHRYWYQSFKQFSAFLLEIYAFMLPQWNEIKNLKCPWSWWVAPGADSMMGKSVNRPAPSHGAQSLSWMLLKEKNPAPIMALEIQVLQHKCCCIIASIMRWYCYVSDSVALKIP